jgi:hypothetical protein
MAPKTGSFHGRCPALAVALDDRYRIGRAAAGGLEAELGETLAHFEGFASLVAVEEQVVDVPRQHEQAVLTFAELHQCSCLLSELSVLVVSVPF